MSHHILIVDDNPTNLKLAAHVLQAEGYTVALATDAEQAQLLLADMTPELILMDIALPGMDGLTLTRTLKADARFARVPIIAMTAFAMKGDEQKAVDAGCEGYITKPIDTRKFSQQIAEFLTPKTNSSLVLSLKVLVVEDDPTDLKLMTAVLQDSGFFVTSRTTAAGMKEAIRVERPELIVLDLRLPDSDGLMVVRMLKADASTQQITVVAVTAYPDRFPREELLAAGCAAVIDKPINTRRFPEQLILAVDQKPE